MRYNCNRLKYGRKIKIALEKKTTKTASELIRKPFFACFYGKSKLHFFLTSHNIDITYFRAKYNTA
jgi:hypothetical protein